jgi:trimeric autotransporter adhesin
MNNINQNFCSVSKFFKPITFIFIGAFLCFVMINCNVKNTEKDAKEKDKYDGPALAAKFEFDRTIDPSTGQVPRERLLTAIQQTIDSKEDYQSAIGGLAWNERGPINDIPGPSNGNIRANNDFASGRVRAILVDKSDATGKTVIIGGVDGGLWKTTDITAPTASWALINDNLSNLAISDITQDPRVGFQNIMYFCTGESYFNVDAVQGNGVYKSIDYGATWTWLPSTSTYVFGTRILCDYLGNIYLATRSGLFRSTVASGGGSWSVDITPSGLSTRICDMEISSTTAPGRLHVVAGIFSTQAYRYTDIPTTVAAGTWTSPATAFPSFVMRAEICVSGSTLYSLVANASYEVPTIYKSTDGGANWAACATSPTAGWASGQGWYNLACDIDPSSGGATCIVGALDTWKTTNGGTTWTQVSTWVGVTPIPQYVHADVHKIIFYDGGNKLLFGSDGGIFFSTDKGITIKDRNKGIRIKQFYSCAIHPSTTNYFLAGAQDNGVHQFNNAGLSNSVEVTGGDGAFVAIDQNEPAYQFGSYVFNSYRRSTNSGATWSSITLNASTGQFINPYDYDNTANIMYCGDIASNYRRWTDPQTGSTSAVVNITSIVGSVTAVSVSPYTANKVFFGTSAGRVVQVDGANVIASGSAGTDRSAGLPGGTVSCINFGTDDLNLIMCESNYGISNVWVSTSGGVSWTAIDGTLPDMPVRWCMFYPGDNTKAYIATETGVWETDLISGGATVWNANPTFPTVRTDMIKYRSSDRTIAAATHGRGLWTTVVPGVATPDLSFQTPTASETESTTFTSSCRGYTDYTKYMVIANSPTGTGTVTLGIAGGATATSGVDYAITTNGNFAAPSMTLSFASGATAPQPFTIRVYNDEAVESAETFTVNYTVTGGDAAPGASNQTMVFTINDNDAAPVSSSTLSASVGTFTSSITSQSPFRGAQARFRLQNLWTASELIAAGFTSARNFTSMTLYVSTKSSSTPFTGFTISMGNSAANTLSSGFVGPTFTTVYPATPYSTVAGANLFTFTTPFAWDGVSNIVIEYCWDNAAAGLSDVTEGNATPLGSGVRATSYYTTNASPPCTQLAGFVSDARVRATFGTAVVGTPVATTIISKTAYLGPNDDVPFYDASGNILARIKNNTAFDYGCTTVEIDRAGTGTSPFWYAAAANQMTTKSFRVTPTNVNPTGNYDITLFYSAAEKAGYEAATGTSWFGLSMVKAVGPISGITPATPMVSTVTVNSVVTQASHGSDYTVKATFTNGFSGFAVGKPGPPLPISLLSFDGRKNGSVVDLTWRTAFEYNNNRFEIETSKDVSNFYKMGTVNSQGNSTDIQTYTYRDNLPVKGVNYYRLKQVDMDGRSTFSRTIAITFDGKGKLITVFPNPAKDKLNVSFASPQQNVLIQIHTADGKLVRQASVGNVQRNADLNVTGLIPGTYLLKILIGNETQVVKFLKE